jgi:O-antigen ligase
MVLVMLAFYFPIREVCAAHPRHVKGILLITVWFALFVFVRNVITYWTGLAAATQLWQIVAGRIVLNEVLLMMPALGALVLVVYDERLRRKMLWGLLFALFTTGLILTRSRGYWVAFAFGVAVLFVLVDGKRKMRMVSVAAIVGGSVLVVGLLFLQELTTLVMAGLVDRVTSLGNALTSDISLVNRFHESKEVWEHIRVNPVVGYGIGARYRVYDLIDDVTMTKPFIHNGFIGMWFKYGLVGLGCLITYWAGVIRTGLRVYRSADSPHLLRLAGLMAAVAMIAEIVVANTSTPFQIADATLMFAICGGVASGAADYLKNRRSPV